MREMGDVPQPEIVLHVAKGIEIKIGQSVPILQHSPVCAGSRGKVTGIDLENNIAQIVCINCGNNVFLDVITLAQSG